MPPGTGPRGLPAPPAAGGPPAPPGHAALPTGPLPRQGPHGTAVGDIAPMPAGPDLDPPGTVDPAAAETGQDGANDAADASLDTIEPDPDVEVDLDDDRAADGWKLVHAAQDGDTDAFGRLFDRYHDVVFRFVLFRLNDRQAAEDLTQETFVRAYRRIGSVSYQGRDIGAWFVTIARNLVLDHVKSSRYRLESATPEIADVAPGSTRPGPEHEVIANATHAELLRCVARLGDDQQECITLRFLQGLSVAETADAMGRNEGAVKALQHRAVRRLAQLLPEELR